MKKPLPARIDRLEAARGPLPMAEAAELAALREIGVELGQGFHLARPAPVPTPVAARPGLFDAHPVGA